MMKQAPDKKTKNELKAQKTAQKKQERLEKTKSRQLAKTQKQELAAQKKAEKPAAKPLKETLAEKLPAINYEFTKREKTLLYILLIFGMLMAIFFLSVMPGLSKFQTLQETKSTAQMEKDEMDLAITSLSANQMMLDAARANLSAKQANFAQKMNNAQLDNEVTTFAVNNGLSPQSLTIDNVTTEALASYGGDTTASTESSGDTTQSTEDLSSSSGTTTTDDSSSTTTTDGATTPKSGVIIGTVTVSFTGTPEALQNALDSAAARSDLQVMGVTYQRDKNTGSLTLNVYMSYQSDQTTPVQQTEVAQ